MGIGATKQKTITPPPLPCSDDPTAAALRAELARRASGGSGPLPPAPRWADDGARGGGGGGDEDVPPQLAASRALVNEGLSGFLPRVKVTGERERERARG